MYREENTQNVYSIDEFGRIVLPSELVRKLQLRSNNTSGSINESGEIFIFKNGDFKDDTNLYLNDLNMVSLKTLNKFNSRYFNIKSGIINDKGYITLTPYQNHCHFCGNEINKKDLFYYNRRICCECFDNIKATTNSTNEKFICSCCGHEHDHGIIYLNHDICDECHNDM